MGLKGYDLQRSADAQRRVAVVTGAGRGIGRAHALRLARDGVSVVVNDIGCNSDGTGADESPADLVVGEIKDLGGDAVSDTTDVASIMGGHSVIGTALEAFGRIDIVVNNAGISGPPGSNETLDAYVNRHIGVHLKSTLGTMEAAIPHMRESGWGRIINTVSEIALDTRLGPSGPYGMAKAAVWSATLSTAAQLMNSGITVNAIAPNARTRMNEFLFEEQPPQIDLNPDLVADVVSYLASNEASDISGHVLFVAGNALREYLVTRTRNTPVVEHMRHVLPNLTA